MGTFPFFFCHMFNRRYRLGFDPESHFSDKDVAVCLQNSFSCAMTFGHRTSKALFTNRLLGGKEILVIKLKGFYWSGWDQLEIDCVKTEKLQQQRLDRVNSLFTYYYSLTLIRRVDFRCFIFQWYYLHTRVTNKSDSRKDKYSTVCSFIITARKITLFLLQLDMINTTVLSWKTAHE